MRPETFVERYEGTCSINNLKPNHVTFIREYEYANKFKEISFPLAVIAYAYEVREVLLALDLHHEL